MGRAMKLALIAVLLAAAAVALVYGPGWIRPPDGAGEARAATAGARGAEPVLLERVSLQPERDRLEAVGTARAPRSVTLHPASPGRVRAVNFEAGDRVEAGAVLVQLDDRAEQVELELARVRLAEAQRELARLQRSPGAFSVATVDRARTAVRVARLEVRRAEVALEDRQVEAPFTGHIGLTEVDPGDRIGPETAIATLDDRSSLLVSFEVPELFLGRLQPGETVSVATWADGKARARGEIVRLDSRVDPLRRTFVARARVENPEDQLRPGMSFRVGLDLEGRRYPLVPEVALQWGDEGAYVWTVREGRAERVPVEIVEREQAGVLVEAPLEAGAAVITEGVQSVHQGMAVEPVGSAAGAPAAAAVEGR